MKKEIDSKTRRKSVKRGAKISGAIGVSAILGHSLFAIKAQAKAQI